MSDEVLIRAEGVSKKFCPQLDLSIKYGIQDVARDLMGVSSKPEELREGEFWAVDDVSFELKKGETLGIIGPNGSGKTTLLKILNGIFMPDKGRIEIKGRVGALIEIGAGFHPLLTGRENIYINGAILGMSKKEIDKKFDSIVDFADISDFLDTPVKFYSSGMYVRLGFAIAVHYEPDILSVDEVLAVGDLAFQKKCLGKMDNVARQGRTVLFVSHSLSAINQLCSRTILLNEGAILKDCSTEEAVNFYIGMSDNINKLDGDLSSPGLRLPISAPESRFKLTNIKVINSQKQPTTEIRFAEPFEVIFRGYADKKCESILVGFGISSKMTGYIFTSHQAYNCLPDTLEEGITEFHVEINPNLLAPGCYEIGVAAVGPGVADYIPVALELHVLDVGITPDKYWHHPHQGGLIDYPCKWSVKNIT